MKIKNLLIFIVAFLFFRNVSAQDSALVKDKAWYIPAYRKFQFAGNIGVFSTGIGYKFFNDKLYSELLLGYVPPFISKAQKIHVITIKNTFPVYSKKLDNYILSPITGFTVSLETGNNSHLKLPSKYPEGYYFTNAFHFTFFVGGMVHKDLNLNRVNGVDLYFELGTVERYLWYAITSKEVHMNDIFSLAIGVNLYF